MRAGARLIFIYKNRSPLVGQTRFFNGELRGAGDSNTGTDHAIVETPSSPLTSPPPQVPLRKNAP